MTSKNQYNEASIKSLDWFEHIRKRPGMYIGKLGDGSSPDDGIYVLLKEVVDNSIDEFIMGFGKRIEVNVSNSRVIVRDYGRGIPLGKLVDCITKINTGAKYDSKVFKKSVGLNGVGIKAVNALSGEFIAESIVYDDSSSVVLEHYGDILIALNNKDEALVFYKKAFDLDQDNNSLLEKISLYERE